MNSNTFEILESRRMLCMTHLLDGSVAGKAGPDLFPGYQFGQPMTVFSEPANIVWTNRANTTTGGPADTDGFGATFGNTAPKARAIIDAIIVQYERMIGSFNYPVSGEFYSLEVDMGSPFGLFSGGAAMQFPLLGGKPHGGYMALGVGNNSLDPNNDNGWFLDATPYDNSEFRGGFFNAFSGTAHTGSPAENKWDFFSVVAAEMTHNLGLYGDLVPGWHALTTDTGAPDLNQGGTGNFWVFRGPSIKHLLTSNQGGVFGIDTGVAVHSAGPIHGTTFEGVAYKGNLDQGTATYGMGQRFTVNQTFALMFKDAFDYASVNPAQFSTGTMYSTLDETTGELFVRGAEDQLAWQSIPVGSDKFSVTRDGNTIVVSVDPYYDSAGAGALPGEGDLPPWVTYYDASQISSIKIDGDSAEDFITLSADMGVPVSIAYEPGMRDHITILGTPGPDSAQLFGDTGSLNNGTPLDFTEGDSITFNGGGGDDLLLMVPTANLSHPFLVTYNAGPGSDQVMIRGTSAAETVNFYDTSITWDLTTLVRTDNERVGFDGGTGGDFVSINNGAQVHVINYQHLAELGFASGAMIADVSSNLPYLLRVDELSMGNTGVLDLNNNSLLVDSPNIPVWQVRNWIISGRNGGTWDGPGITSSMAKDNPQQNTALGWMDDDDWHAIAGANALFHDQPLDNDATIVKYTYYGDTDLNGIVNFDDYARLDAGFLNGATGWTNGDFDMSGQVDFDDYGLIDLAFNSQGQQLRPGAGQGKLRR